jgi:predicted Zn-dependent peptidase
MQSSLRGWRGICAAVVTSAVAGAGAVAAQDMASFEKRLTVHTLPNGYTFLILERPGAPVFSFATRVDVGSAQEVPGITGLAHMFEHMAFKGTPRLGTKDYAKEKVAIEELEAAYQAYERARAAVKPDQAEVDRLLKAFKEKEAAAQEFVVANAFDEALSREGGVGLNASTSAEATTYYYSLPTNKFELFAYLESERFIHPVYREFYKERDVVMEERRQRTESQPIGKLIERMLSTAFLAHPYKQPTVGYMSDLQRFTLTDAEAFFRKYYVPANMVTAIVGNVKAKEIIPILDKYFGRLPKGEKPPALRTLEPPQASELTIVLREKTQPIYIEGYHKPAATDPSEPAYDAIADILTRGRTSRLYRLLVRDKQLAVAVQGAGAFPGAKYPHLFVVFAVPARGVKTEAVVEAIHPELEKLKTEDVTDDELARFKTRAKADLIRSLNSNEGLAEALANYHTMFGDWRELFKYVDRMEAVTKADIRKAAAATFTAGNRTVAKIETVTPGGAK